MTAISRRHGSFNSNWPDRSVRPDPEHIWGGLIVRTAGNRSGTAFRRGVAAVEMALVLPVFIAVVLGIIEFGRAMWVSNLVTNSAREGGRMAVLDGSSNAQVKQAISDFLTSTLGVSSGDITTTITITPYTGNANPANECA